jgi:ABC-type nitrate/sulfonate/bicarbonate transport system ATPase subunit
MIELKNLTIGYDKTPILSNINYVFEDNKIYGILGKSGFGKTTLLRTMCGILKPISGEILVNGKKFTSAREDGIYMMFQNYTSFDWLNCLENVLIIKRINGKVTEKNIKVATELLRLVGLGDKLDKYPTQLSGGQKQRLALARTIFMDPAVVLMDEPLSALDEKTRADMQQLIKNDHDHDKNIIIMITHSSEEANKMCDVVINIETDPAFHSK